MRHGSTTALSEETELLENIRGSERQTCARHNARIYLVREGIKQTSLILALPNFFLA